MLQTHKQARILLVALSSNLEATVNDCSTVPTSEAAGTDQVTQVSRRFSTALPTEEFRGETRCTLGKCDCEV